jgi:hypothetical protein
MAPRLVNRREPVCVVRGQIIGHGRADYWLQITGAESLILTK